MGARTTIEWTQSDDGTAGASWNPATGCTKASPGCDHCYAETFAERFRGTPGHYFEHGFDLQLRPDKLDEPLRWRRPRHVFLSSMSDIFHPAIPDDYLASIFAVMAIAERHTFLVLTKRHARMRSLLRNSDFRDQVAEAITDRMATTSAPGRHWPVRYDRTTEDGLNIWGPTTWPLPNVALGVSAEDQHWADIRLNALYDTPAAIRFLSAEPLLGAITLRGATPAQLDWVIVGGESGPGARPMDADWVTEIRDQCVANEVAFFFKQWGGRTPKANGRQLEGRTWDQMPSELRQAG